MAAIYLIRHGQASFAADDYDELSGLGAEQARILGQSLAQRLPRVDAVVCGGMRRHRQTAEHCLDAMGLARDWREDADWNEYDHREMIARLEPRYADQAALQGEVAKHDNPRQAFQQIFGRAASRWVGGEFDHDYTESWPAFCTRVERALERVVADTGRSQHALVFTSGGAISVVCRKLLQLGNERTLQLNYVMANGGVTKLICGSSGAHLSTLNEHAHFEGERRELLTYR